MERSVTAAGLGTKEVLLIKSYLGLLPGKTRDAWEYRDSGPADVTISVRGEGAEGGDGLRIAYGEDDGSGLCLTPPIRVANLIAMLDRASNALQSASGEATTKAATPAAEPAAQASFVQDSLAELLRARLPNQRRMLMSDGNTWIEADFDQRSYRSSHPLTAAHASQGGWKLTETAAVPFSVDGPLTYLQWMAGVAEARVQPGTYRLQRWPDFGRLPHRPSFLRLAAYFSRTGSSPTAAASAALVPFPDVEAFLGGCILAGYAKRLDEGSTPAPAPVAKPDAGMLGFLSQIRKRLGL